MLQENTDKQISIIDSLTIKNAVKLGIEVTPDGGTVYAAFYRSDDDLINTYLVRSEDGVKTFSEPVRVNLKEGDAANVWYPVALDFSPTGELYVAWAIQHKDVAFPWGGVRDFKIAKSTDGGENFGPPISPGNPPLREGSSVERTFFDLAVSDKGTVFLSYLALGISSANGVAEYAEQEGASASTKVFRSLSGGKSFDNPVLGDSVCVCCHTKAVVSPAGEVYFSWRSLDKSTAKQASSTYSSESGKQNDTVRDPVVARTLDGGIGNAYSKPRRISGKRWFINGCPSSGTGIDIDKRGRIHAAYFTGSGEAGEGIGYYYAYSDDNGASFTRIPLLTADFIPLVHQGTSLAVDEKGNAWITFITPKLSSDDDEQETGYTGNEAVVYLYVIDNKSTIVTAKKFETDTVAQPVISSSGKTTVLAFAKEDNYKINSLSLISEGRSAFTQ